MDLLLSIVSFNTRDLLDRCLASICANPPAGSFEVVVVDNGSTDGSVEMVRAKHPQVRLILAPHNPGYAGGNNLALAGSDATHKLILNSDTEMYPGTLRTLQEFMGAHPEAGMCAARLILPDGSGQQTRTTPLTLGYFAAQQLWPQRTSQQPNTSAFCLPPSALPSEVERLEGACMFGRAAALDQVGPMDEGYWMYCEDDDYCRRLRTAGWKLYVVPEATILHRWAGSTGTASPRLIAAYGHAAARYFRKWHGPLAGLAARALAVTGAAMRTLLWSLATIATLGLIARLRQRAGVFARAFWLLLLPPRFGTR